MIDKIKGIIETKGIQAVPKTTYDMRERGENMIYFSKATWNNNTKSLMASPKKSEKEFIEFFDQTAEGCRSFPKYSLFIYEDRVEFTINKEVEGKIVKESLI